MEHTSPEHDTSLLAAAHSGGGPTSTRLKAAQSLQSNQNYIKQGQAMSEDDIVYENGRFWVARECNAFVVYRSGITHSVSDSAYARTQDGLSVACARCDYLANRFSRQPHTETGHHTS